MLSFALDLTWVRHKTVGGTEAYVNNLIQGFIDTKSEFNMVMVTARDNYQLFNKYIIDKRVTIVTAPVNSAFVIKRIIWQNLYLSRFILKQGINLCLEPVYSKPILGTKKVKYVTVIHDLEALHFPENHSIAKNIWLRLSWLNTIKTSCHIICISDFVRKDVINRYKIDEDNVSKIFNPINIDISNQCDFSFVSGKYGISKKNYYYTVSKLNPHKNLGTLVRVFGEIKKRRIKELPCKLIISGIDGGMIDKLRKIAKEYYLLEELVFTGYVDESIRNCLYSNAKAFLFPSIFEGFGMPAIEAIKSGTTVVTTKMACIPEITQNIANYVNDAYSPDDWIESMLKMENRNDLFNNELYSPNKVAERYLMILNLVVKEVKK